MYSLKKSSVEAARVAVGAMNGTSAPSASASVIISANPRCIGIGEEVSTVREASGMHGGWVPQPYPRPSH